MSIIKSIWNRFFSKQVDLSHITFTEKFVSEEDFKPDTEFENTTTRFSIKM